MIYTAHMGYKKMADPTPTLSGVLEVTVSTWTIPSSTITTEQTVNGGSGKAGPSARLQLAQGQEYRQLEDIVTTLSLDTEGDPAPDLQLQGMVKSTVVHFLTFSLGPFSQLDGFLGSS